VTTTIEQEQNTRTIPLTQGQVAIVDDGDYEELAKYKWYAQKIDRRVYAVRKVGPPNARLTLYMHRQILNPRPDQQCDHINGNGIDNRRANLRLCTHTQNCYNMHIDPNHSSRFKGVLWDKERRKWRAEIVVDYKTHYLGRFADEKVAALSYDTAAREYFGEFACVNFPINGEQQ